MKNNKENTKPVALKSLQVKNFILLTVAGFINAFGITVFLAPVKLYDSGISGTSMLLSQVTPEWMSLWLFLLVLNIPLFIFGLKKQGSVSTIYAKKLGITVGTFVMVYNVILYIICGFAIKSWILPLYSIVTYMAALKTIDFVVEGIDSVKIHNYCYIGGKGDMQGSF